MYKPELRQRIINLRRDNKTIKEIANICNKTETSITSYLAKYQIYKIDTRTPQIDSLNEADLAYIAGIIDGEGSIIINKLKESKGTHLYRYQLFVKVVNTDERLLKYLSQKTSTSYFKDKRTNNTNRRNTFSIHWSIKSSVQILQKIYPYLVIKKEQVDLALNFVKTFDICYGNKKTPIDIMDKRHDCYLKMKALHKIEFK